MGDSIFCQIWQLSSSPVGFTVRVYHHKVALRAQVDSSEMALHVAGTDTADPLDNLTFQGRPESHEAKQTVDIQIPEQVKKQPHIP